MEEIVEIVQTPEVHMISTPLDYLGREILPGDILIWHSGGSFSRFMSCGKVIDISQRSIRVINHNDNKVTIWNTHRTVIIARYPNYDLIPHKYKWLYEEK